MSSEIIMAIEKLPYRYKNYQYARIVEINNDAQFKEFCKNQLIADRVNTLYFLEIPSKEEDDKKVWYSYDYFQNIKSFDQLSRLRLIIDQKNIQTLSNLQKNTSITLTEQAELAGLAKTYGYPHNYRSSMWIGRNYGWSIGCGIGIALGIALVITFCIFTMPIIFAVMDVLMNLLLLGVALFVGMCALGFGGTVFINEVIAGVLGALIGMGIGALVQYIKEIPVQNKMLSSKEDNSRVEKQNLDPQLSNSKDDCSKNLENIFSSPLFGSATSNPQLSFCETFREVLFEDTPFAPLVASSLYSQKV